MEFNKIISDFTYLGSTILEIVVKNHIVTLGPDVPKEFGFDFAISDVSESESEHHGRIVMKVSVFLTYSDDLKDEFTIELEGAFSAPISMAKEEFINLLSLNGATALYSIARSKVETISAATFMNGKLVLPMINILSFIQEKTANNSSAIDTL